MSEELTRKIDNFFSQYRVCKYPKGQILLLAGDKASYVYYLVQGRVKQYDVTYRGDEIILNIFKPPAFFPMSLVVGNEVSQYIFEAETEIELHLVPCRDAIAFVKDNPDVLFDLLIRVYRGVDGLLGRMTQLMAGSARERLVYEMVVEARRFGEIDKSGEVLLNIGEKDLAARAALSRETVSRELHRLKDENLVDVSGKGILLKDLKVLETKVIAEI